jgi:YfiR/HmsC-like
MKYRTETFVRVKAALVNCAALIAFGLISSKSLAAEQDIHALRSAYLYYFTHFINWPKATVFENNQFNFCVLDDNEKDRFQLSTINGKTIGDLRLNIIYFENTLATYADTNHDGSLLKCHAIYFNESHTANAAWRTLPIPAHTLVVTEGDHPTDFSIGDIHLFQLDNRLNFQVNDRELTVREFKVSSKLLRLSKVMPR